MSIGFGPSFGTLRSQRLLEKAGSDVSAATERLSTGLRVNRPSDDPASSALAAVLSVNSRINERGVRNLNDGISLLNVAESGLSEVNSLLARIKELANMAANGTATSTQRAALNTEAQGLRNEATRIIQSTKFNGQSVLAGGYSLRVQGGVGPQTSLDMSFGLNLTTSIPDGTFAAFVTASTNTNGSRRLEVADFNGDGTLDFLTFGSYSVPDRIEITPGNGNGTFGTQTEQAIQDGILAMDSGDVDGDGDTDILFSFANYAQVYKNNGTGTFTADVTISAGTAGVGTFHDPDGDGDLDIVFHASADGSLGVYTNSGAGSYGAVTTIAAGIYFPTTSVSNTGNYQFADFDGDGDRDLVGTVHTNGERVRMFLNSGGTYTAQATYDPGDARSSTSLAISDLNNDGKLDIAIHSVNATGRVRSIFGDGAGGWSSTVFADGGGGGGGGIILRDVNNDGLEDAIVAAASTGQLAVHLGNSNGSFAAPSTIFSGTALRGLGVGDFNSDGLLDLAMVYEDVTPSGVRVSFGGGTTISGIPVVDLTSQATARTTLTDMTSALTSVATQQSTIGTNLSRLGFALRHLQTLSVGQAEAASRLTDVDVAEETTNLVAAQVRQQSATAILAQAKLSPEIALRLLSEA